MWDGSHSKISSKAFGSTNFRPAPALSHLTHTHSQRSGRGWFKNPFFRRSIFSTLPYKALATAPAGIAPFHEPAFRFDFFFAGLRGQHFERGRRREAPNQTQAPRPAPRREQTSTEDHTARARGRPEKRRSRDSGLALGEEGFAVSSVPRRKGRRRGVESK